MLHCCKQSLDYSILVTSNLYAFLLQIYSGIVESTASQVTIKEVSWSELIVLDVDSYFALLGLFLGGAQLA